MRQNINIEAEGNELVLKNKAGDYVIVPKKYRLEVQDMIKENCHDCIDKLVETLPVMEDYASDGSIMPNDNEDNFKYKSYTAAQDNTYVASRVVKEQNKKQQFVPRERPVLKADTRTDQERGIAQKYTEAVLNPSISTQIGETLQKPLRWLSDPVKGVGDIVSAIAPNSSLAKDLPNTHADTFEHRKKQLNPYTSNREKISNTINEAVPLTNMALLNILPVEAAAGNIVKSGKNLIKPVSKVVGKTDDAIKAGSKVLSKTDDAVKPIVSSVYDVAYPVTRTTPNSGYTFKTISPNKEKIAIHESNKYHDVMWVAKNDIDNFFINNKIDVSKLPESKLVGSEVGYDWILPEGITHDMLNEFARLHHGKPITQEMRNIAKAIKEANPNVKFSGTSHELHGIASNIHPDYLGKFGQGLSNVDKAGSKVLNKTDDVVKNLPKLEQIPLDFNIEDILKNISPTERKNMEIVKKGNAYFKELDNPESLKRLKEFGDEYGIDLLDAYKKAEQRWDYGTNIGRHDRFKIKELPEGISGRSETNKNYEDFVEEFRLEQKYGKDSKKVKSFIEKINQNNSVNFISPKVELEDYNRVIWHELSHDINKAIINSSPKLKKDISEIFINDVSKISDKDEPISLIAKSKGLTLEEYKLDYITEPTETWAFLSTNLRQDLKNTGIIKNYNEILTPEKLEQAIKNGNTVFSRFEPYIKDKEAFIKLFNKMTLSIAPAALYLQSQNQNKNEQ